MNDILSLPSACFTALIGNTVHTSSWDMLHHEINYTIPVNTSRKKVKEKQMFKCFLYQNSSFRLTGIRIPFLCLHMF